MAVKILQQKEIEISCSQGISVELRHALPSGWTFTEAADSFIVHGPHGDEWQNQLWHVVRFLAYPAFLSLKRTRQGEGETCYEMLSANAAGRGFRIEFIFRGPQKNADGEEPASTDAPT